MPKSASMIRLSMVVVCIGLWITPLFGQWAANNSYAMEEYANALKSDERRRARRAAKTDDEFDGSLQSSETFGYPSLVMQFGVGLSEGLAKIRSKGKVGYIDSRGKIVIPARFKEGGRFSGGLAAVKFREKWGFIDHAGRFVVPPIFEWACMFQEGRALVRFGGKWGYINERGEMVIKPRFDHASSFSEGLAAVRLYEGKYKTGYMDRNGQWVLKPTFDGGSDFNEGRAIVVKDIGYKNGVVVESHVIDRTGRPLFELRSWYHSSYSEGLLVVSNNARKFGYLDLNGHLVIPYQFDHARAFQNGLASVTLGGEELYIDKRGQVVPGFRRHCSGSFSSGMVACEESGKWGFVDASGKTVIMAKYDRVLSFSSGLAVVFIDENTGYIDRTGKYVWRPTN